jgi:hypothetical protein
MRSIVPIVILASSGSRETNFLSLQARPNAVLKASREINPPNDRPGPRLPWRLYEGVGRGWGLERPR